ncbi:FkbM family methyltransferase [Rhizobium sp. G21]|uniref:FkbM family methyltransferase n=1 Tax=Rhizobium sp. G21 TaxID=2758439 RepID=UPI0016011C1C|nr:FkbM family methyltransferase [Rhizobium sp. G21]MBB1248298.1 FkbM family methyltransferase [Rhizobium sp. G21]
METDYKFRIRGMERPLTEMHFRHDDQNVNENHILQFLRAGGAYEPDVTNLFRLALRPGDVLVDIGANVGYFSVLGGLLVGPGGRVISAEPDPKNIDRIRLQCRLNGLEVIDIVDRPLAEAERDAEFFFNAKSSGGNALWDPVKFNGDAGMSGGARTMRTTTLDAVLAERGLDGARLVKIDTEGAEQLILRGAGDLLDRKAIRFIVAEMHQKGLAQLGGGLDEMLAYMAGKGYLCFLLYYDGRPPQFLAPGMAYTAEVMCNALFSTPDGYAELWPAVTHNPGMERDPVTGKLRLHT